VRNFSLAFVQIDGVVNTAGWHDPQMRLMVLADDVPDTLNGTRPPEPLFVRALSNECVVSRATNLIPEALEEDDFQIFTPTDSIGQHIHLFKFDVTSSDGGANGWNYEDGVFAAEEVVARIKAANALGGALVADGTLNQSGARVPLAATSNPFVPLAPLGAQTGTQRFWADPLLDIQGMDRTLRSAFMHDHLSASSHQQHGLYAAIVVEPWFSEWRDPETGQLFGTRPDGGPTSYRADIIVPGVMVFREFNLAIQDFALLYDDFDNPVNPPGAEEAPLPLAIKPGQGGMPEVVSARDPGSMLVNYRNEPIPLRIAQRQANGTFKLKSGQKGEMQNVFRSNLHGDPATPILEIYRGDPVQIRAIDASHEEQHAFSINGRTWLKESEDPSSGLTNVEPMGVSERFDLVLRNDEVSAGDYLYASAPTDDLWNGLWGILRSHGKLRPNLLPLPGYAPTEKDPAGVCPPNAPVRSYTVHAVTAKDALPGGKLYYNKEYDLWDPDAILFIEASKLAAVESGARKPEPLILRAAAGDCIKVTLINELPSSPPKTPHWNYNPPITDGFNTNQVLPSNHVSLHAQLLRYDIETSDGANIGKNKVQTVPPGDSRTYTWYAGGRVPNGQGGTVLGPIEFGTVNLRDMADVVNHGMHGAVGQLIVEPLGASWVEDPGTSAQATVTYVDAAGKPKSFRDFVVVYQDEIGLHTGNASFKCAAVQLNCGTAVRNLGAEDDAEDSGHDGFNYRLEPLWARYGLRPELAIEALNNIDQSGALDSDVFGDPATPIFVATPGKAIRIRVGAPSGHARQHAFTPWGTEFPRNPFAAGSGSRVIGPNPTSPVAGTVNTVTAQVHETVVPLYGAGGKYAIAGDYLYRDEPSFSFTDGAWGILRVAP
jgi:hypothetical protein